MAAATAGSLDATKTWVAQADLGIDKQVQGQDGNPAPVAVLPGQVITYSLTVTNAGPSDAQGVAVVDPLPAVFTQVALGAVTPPWLGCALSPPGAQFLLTCSAATMPAGSTATVTLTAVVPVNLPDGTVISNTATVTAQTPQVPDTLPNTDTASVIVGAVADLSVTKTDSPDPVSAGANLNYTITVANGGPNAAQSVSLTDTLPAGMTFVSLSAPAGLSCTTPAVGATGTVTCSIASLAAAAPQTLTLVAQVGAGVASGTVISNTATVSAATTDPNPANNSATTTTTVATAADLSVTKSVTPAETVSGGGVTYTLSVSNAGPSDAANVTLSDTFPAQLQGVTVVDDGPYTCAPVVGNTLTCTIASHPVGVVATITVNATIVPGTYLDLTTVSNTATVSSQTTDPDPADDSATATFKIRSTPAISVTKTATPASVPEPGRCLLRPLVTNTGNVAVSLTSLVDDVHGDVNGKGSCAVPQQLAAGASYTCSFTASVRGIGGTVETDVVTARAATLEGRQATASDDATVTITDIVPAIAVTKTAVGDQAGGAGRRRDLHHHHPEPRSREPRHRGPERRPAGRPG